MRWFLPLAIKDSEPRFARKGGAYRSCGVAQKYMMMGYLGYKNKNGKAIVERYIRTLNLSNVEKQELLEMSGY